MHKVFQFFLITLGVSISVANTGFANSLPANTQEQVSPLTESEPLEFSQDIGLPPMPDASNLSVPQNDDVLPPQPGQPELNLGIQDPNYIPAEINTEPSPEQSVGSLSGENDGSGLYYDSTLAPSEREGLSRVPKRVDPVDEPAQKFIIVEKNAGISSQEAQVVAANRALKLGRYSSAMEMFEQLYKKNSRDPRILMGLAVAQQKSGFVESAMNTYEELLQIYPDNTDALINMLGLMKNQYPSVAVRRLLELREKYPKDAGIAAQLGLVSAEMGSYEDAFRYLGVASSIEPSNALHPYNMAIVADMIGDKGQAIELYEEALRIDAMYGGGRSITREDVYERLAVLRR